MLSGLVLRLSATQWKDAFVQTMRRMKIPVLVIAQVLGLGFLTRYSGTDAVLGLAFTGAGVPLKNSGGSFARMAARLN